MCDVTAHIVIVVWTLSAWSRLNKPHQHITHQVQTKPSICWLMDVGLDHRLFVLEVLCAPGSCICTEVSLVRCPVVVSCCNRSYKTRNLLDVGTSDCWPGSHSLGTGGVHLMTPCSFYSYSLITNITHCDCCLNTVSLVSTEQPTTAHHTLLTPNLQCAGWWIRDYLCWWCTVHLMNPVTHITYYIIHTFHHNQTVINIQPWPCQHITPTHKYIRYMFLF